MKGNFDGGLNFINIGNMQENAKFKPIDCTVFPFCWSKPNPSHWVYL